MRTPGLSVLLRSSVVAFAVVVLVAATFTSGASPDATSWLVAAVAIACALTAALNPDGQAAAATLVALGVNWLLVVNDELSVLTPVAACCGVLLHSAVAVEAVTPRGARLPRPAYRLWAIRTVAVAASAFALWGVALATDGAGSRPGVVPVLALGVLLGGGIWLVRVRVLGRQRG